MSVSADHQGSSPPSPPSPPPPAAAAAATATATAPPHHSPPPSSSLYPRQQQQLQLQSGNVNVNVNQNGGAGSGGIDGGGAAAAAATTAASRSPVLRQDERVDPQIQQQQLPIQQSQQSPDQSSQQHNHHLTTPVSTSTLNHHVDQDPSITPFTTPTHYPSIERAPDSQSASIPPPTSAAAAAATATTTATAAAAAAASQSWDAYDAAATLASHAQLAQGMDTADAQLAEVLQRDVQDPATATAPVSALPPSSDQSTAKYSVGLPSQPRNNAADDSVTNVDLRKLPNYAQRQPAVQQIGPKRKRVFSNRTKTGCLTCRRRKKKCDEARPACNNCIRGGFLCEGYSSSRTWQKPSSTKQPLPLQSRDGGHYDDSAPYPQDLSPQRQDRSRSATVTQIPGDQSKPLQQEYHDVMRDIPHPSTTGVMTTNDDSRHGLAATAAAANAANAAPSASNLSVHNNSRNFPAAQARMALSMESTAPSQSPGFESSSQCINGSGDQLEREKMMSGEPYRPLDPVLVRDRERCKAAISQYTNSRNPLHGISHEEQLRLLRQIFQPPFGLSHHSAESDSLPATSPIGHLSSGTVVELPFNCHYGYNIHFGENVHISENCLMADDCSISIGSHTWVGPNVTILSSMAMGSMQERKGSQSRYQGRPVVIAEDCWIGANVTIMPGVTLGRGAYIASGEVITSQILPYGFQGVKPNYL